jgi:hypothetical protein
MWNWEEGMPDYPSLYPSMFSKNGFWELPPRRKWDHAINLVEGHVPPRGRCYPLAVRGREALREFITTNIQDVKIRGSDSPYASPFFLRPKPGTTKLHGIQDYQK